MGLKELVEISHEFGANPEFVLAGGGNTSFKDADTMWVKSSGYPLATIRAEEFVALARGQLAAMATKAYPQDPAQREEAVKNDLLAARRDPAGGLRPSVEASLHDLIPHTYVVHTHPHLVVGLVSGKDSEAAVRRIFGDDPIYVPYTDPGFTLYKRVAAELAKRRAAPKLIFLENHGVFVGGATIDEIRRSYAALMEKLRAAAKPIPDSRRAPPPPETAAKLARILPAVRMRLSGDTVKVGTFAASPLTARFTASAAAFEGVSSAFTPDQIVYCRTRALFVDADGAPAEVVAAFEAELARHTKKYGYLPNIVAFKGLGVAGFEENAASAAIALEVYEDAMRVSAYAESFGGPRFLSREAIAFIEAWEVENYRRTLSKGAKGANKLSQRIAIVTGGAQGFGQGIVEALHADGANVVVADLNVEKGAALAEALSARGGKNRVRFLRADVSDAASVERLVADTVLAFGGLDLFVSNAGILRAGSLDELDAATFELMTRVNYSAYFHGAKYASPVMKLQHAHRPGHVMDIVQINSKSGLEGSNKNFAYAGAKFGGIGLTQSFALELMPHGIKVNAICPGNFFDGPLWSDPEKGLFVQYLRAGKVPGAKTVEDVKRFYEEKVPAKRGCTVLDVMRALRYVVEQEYETGQAVPVTGGQVMLS